MRHRFRSGDRDALGELYDEHAQVLYRYALRVTGDWAEAEDVVSTTFLEAWRGREKVRPGEESLRPWLLGIATNVMRRNARARRRRDVALARVPERGAVPDFVDDLVAHLADTEQLRVARIALGKLRRRDREVFTLVVWAGLDYAAAAEVLGVPVGTVRSRLSRARGRLRELATAETREGREDSRGRKDSQGRQVTAPQAPPTAPGGPSSRGPQAPRAATRWPTVVPGPAPATPAPAPATPAPAPSPDSHLPGRFSVAPSLTQENHG
ncbi:sigma-70 family RNA polymerase sigma factor [Streptomyces sp. 71268]|uniref:RNA polymerase sigma factor n=1 Tax=Streptomyces sp. 71268 TaxID=3002640 RepID=UPI0023F94530|nr:sigma-70 family RNA polymerase sigma factor [Streptomyces sp. 71268]WEV26293.1 sigma-70 family RNA polymerase sigma factor [Streptomyces sp. 71268]